ncbi:D-aspartate oxidase-like [Physella acuta]|uniref:D-aspartate oxidase-like n=1 Tax=Physella acuta TaxID=109671 RepID=UPI0027DC88E2|nr:D-aspartate oxidase-like [Physella acuta]XP_059176388.1 D-aspartate oxidase-like [Physella acuta]
MVKIAVIGAGVMGLSTAVNLQKLIPDAKVTIIADKFGTDTTSTGAGGYFRPNMDDFHVEDKEMVTQWVKDSWEFYSELAQSPSANESGQTLVSGTVVYNKPQESAYSLLATLSYDFHQVSEDQLRRLNLNYKYGYSFTTVITHTEKFCKWLTERFQAAGGVIQKRKINDIKELAGEFDIVVNCCGLGARELVHDEKVYPVRGHLVMVDAPWMKTFFLSEDDVYLIPHVDKLIIGGTREPGKFNTVPDPATREHILSRAQALFPQLKGVKVLREWVGLRPKRDKIRFEMEIMDCSNKVKLPIFHNYGHGGHGITLGWGAGVGAAKAIKDVCQSSRSRL